MSEDYVVRLFKLQAEAEGANQFFLAHLIGLAIIEAHQILTDAFHDAGSHPGGRGR